MKMHFISGLPRSGSTLLAAILRQNPRFVAGKASPVSILFTALEESMSMRRPYGVQFSTLQKMLLLRGLFQNYYYKTTDGSDDVIFDKSRAWCEKVHQLVELFAEAKVLCPVRNVAWIMDSCERLIRMNAFDLSGMVGYDADLTVYGRCSLLGKSDGMVGWSYDALRQAYFGEHSDRLILIDYDTLVRHPAWTIGMVYDFLGEPKFEHDFDHVTYEHEAFDAALGTPGLHDIRPKVEWRERPTILPPDLFERYAQHDFWTRYPKPSDARLIIAPDNVSSLVAAERR
jgi:sulfotransferase